MSFGMIFSIILILIFIAFSFTVIKNWLELGTTTQIESFVDNLGKDVNETWKSSQGSDIKKYNLPGKVDKVCFVDYSSNAKGAGSDMQEYMDETYSDIDNLFFYPKSVAKDVGNKEIKNIDIETITSSSNPFCINNVDGKVSMVLQKSFNEAQVTITNLASTN